MNIPNLITVGRILLVPLTIWFLILDQFGLAFATFVTAGISDGIDGYLARRMKLQTVLGAYLDPMADKALLVSTYVTLGFLKVLPSWLVILVVSRDVLIIGAIILGWLIGQPMRVAPLLVSKANTLAQILFVVAVLGFAALEQPLDLLLYWGSIPVGLLTAASGAAYLIAWIRHMGATKPEDQGP